jgi:hypothetical protein
MSYDTATLINPPDLSANALIRRDTEQEWLLGLRCWREKEIRAGRSDPWTEQEKRWAEEGPVDNDQLQSLQRPE